MGNQQTNQDNFQSDNEIQFTDIFDIEDVQRLQDLFADTNGVASIITKPDGTPITKSSNFTRFCEKIVRQTEKGCSNCYKSDAIIGSQHLNGPIIQPCLSSGLWDAGASISVNGKHIASWLIGQVRNEELDEKKILEYADEIGANRQEFSKALKEVPVMSVDQFQKVANLLFAFANDLSDKAYAKVQLEKLITENEKRAEDIIKQEKQYRSLFENMLEGSAIHELIFNEEGIPIDYRIIEVNSSFERILGLSKSDVIGKNSCEAYGVNEPPYLDIYSKVALSGQSHGFEIFFAPLNKHFYISAFRTQENSFTTIFEDITDQKIAEQALIENTAFLDKIIESASVSTWISDKDGFAIRTNQACLDFFGATEEEVVGKYNIFNDSVLEEKGFMPEIHKVFEKGEVADIIVDYDFAEVKHVQVKNATHKIVNSILTPVINSNGEVSNVIVQAIDLTEIKNIEAKAIDERNKAQQYLDIAGVMLLSLDNDGIIQLINPKGCEILGFTKEEIFGKNWYDNFLPEYEIERVKDVKKKALLGNIDEMRYFENEIITKTGEKRLIAWKNALLKDENGKITGTLSSGEDITDRKKFEAELLRAKEKAEESENFLTNIINGIGDPVFVKDEQRRFVVVNEAFCATIGRKHNEIIGKNLANDLPKEEEEVFMKIDNQILADGIENINEEYLTGRAKETKTISTRKTRYVDDKGNKFVIGVIRDITQRIQQKLELLEAKEKAEQSDHLKTAFLQNLSHEIRTPMNSIMGFASLLPDEEDKALINNYSEIIVKNSEQLVHIIDDIVIFSRLQNKQMPISLRNFDLHKLLSEVHTSFDIPEYQKGVALVIDNCCDNSKMIYSDYEKVWQIFTNLISNAFKYTSSGTISFGIDKGENEWICFVKDTGIGIPEDEIDKIFERFYRATNVNKGKIGGTGLGLCIVQELVQLLKGKIWVESDPDGNRGGKGSTFYFSIPLISK